MKTVRASNLVNMPAENSMRRPRSYMHRCRPAFEATVYKSVVDVTTAPRASEGRIWSVKAHVSDDGRVTSANHI